MSPFTDFAGKITVKIVEQLTEKVKDSKIQVLGSNDSLLMN